MSVPTAANGIKEVSTPLGDVDVASLPAVAHEDLGPEAIRRLRGEGFPAIVLSDGHGGDLSQDGQTQYAREGA